MGTIVKLNTVQEYNRAMGVETLHPLVSVVDFSTLKSLKHGRKNFGFYCVFLKQLKCGELSYGRSTYDYQEGTLVFVAPGQVAGIDDDGETLNPQGWVLAFHPDLLRGTSLGRKMKDYSFFSYEANEALHMSERERQIIFNCFIEIQEEWERAIDKHSKDIIASTIELLLNHCQRFYDRQFITRNEVNKAILNKMDIALDGYIQSGQLKNGVLPSTKYCADILHLSPRYFSDLLKFETGKNLDEYFQLKRLEVAKEMLLGKGYTVSSVAEKLGYPSVQYFSNLFRKLVGVSPCEYRLSQN